MNLNRKYIHGRSVIIKKHRGYIEIENLSDNYEKVIVPKIFKFNNENVLIKFKGKVLFGNSCSLKFVNRKKQIVGEIDFLTEAYLKLSNYCLMYIRVAPKSKIRIDSIEIDYNVDVLSILSDFLKSDTLLMTPGYPSDSNKYNCAFVHTRVKEYEKSNLSVDVFSLSFEEKTIFYEFEGVKVCKTSFGNARMVLQNKKYKRILIHFFNENFSNILDTMNVDESRVYLYCHGADVLYRDFNKTTALYFKQPQEDSIWQKEYFKLRDEIIKKYNNKKNVKWFFVTDWTRKRSEELIGIKYNNYEILPCLVDEKTFNYEIKNPELRKKIFILRKFDNINTYSIDIDVRVILELSRRKIFNDLEFNIYGEGSEHDILLRPLRKFKNVHIYNHFLTHEEISKVHKKNGIALFATRYDSQAVSSCEAAMSGLVVISSDNTGVYQEIAPEFNTLCETENYIQYADKIEELYNNPKLFSSLSQKMHDYISKIYNYDQTIKKEIEIFKKDSTKSIDYKYKEPESPLLTIAIPSYNVEKFLENGVNSLINHDLSSKIEVLIINDGSKDKTAEIGKKLQKKTTVNKKSIVKIVNKENGGHGSTINKGIELANGKYFKLMDGDDFFETEELKKLIKILENEDSDIILNNYVEDFSLNNTRVPVKNYEFMVPGLQYNINDLCYSGYGFNSFGPLLSTSTYKTEMLKKANFKISENCFYVDMELNQYAYIFANTITYYPLNLYVYYIGRNGQSISTESLKKNCDMHRHVTLNLIKIYYDHSDMSEEKKAFLFNNLILNMINGHYYVCQDLFRNGKKFRKFESEFKKYPEFYNNPRILTKKIKFNRLFNGHLILMRWPIRIIKKIFRRK